MAVGGKAVLHDVALLDVPAIGAVRGPAIDLRRVTAQAAAFHMTLDVVRCGGSPHESLSARGPLRAGQTAQAGRHSGGQADPFNKGKK